MTCVISIPGEGEMMGGESILVVDDEPAMGAVLVKQLKQEGYVAHTVSSGREALGIVSNGSIDLVITDLRMPGMDGMELLAELGRVAPEVPAIMLTGYGNVQRAVDAMKAGAKEFMMKPHERDELVAIVGRTLDAHVRNARRHVSSPRAGDVVIASPAMRECRDAIARAAKSTATVLLRGETGVGKEVAARTIHHESGRKGEFATINCSAVPEQLLEAELFGYAKGSFTGAIKDKPGWVELVEGGTLFLDEIGDVTPAVQVKLLRLLSEKEYQRVGGTRTERADVRFIAATNRDLEKMVEERTFREDLFFRISVIPIRIPALRDRRDDIPPLARRFCARAAEENKKTIALSDAAIELLREQGWRGNVRELQAFVERLVVFSDGAEIMESDIQRELLREPLRPLAGQQGPPSSDSLRGSVIEAKRQSLVDALKATDGNRSAAARLLGVDRRTVHKLIKELGIE